MIFELKTKQEAIHKLSLFSELVDGRDVQMAVRGTFKDKQGELAFLRSWRAVTHIADVHGFAVEIDGEETYLLPNGQAFDFQLEAL